MNGFFYSKDEDTLSMSSDGKLKVGQNLSVLFLCVVCRKQTEEIRRTGIQIAYFSKLVEILGILIYRYRVSFKSSQTEKVVSSRF